MLKRLLVFLGNGGNGSDSLHGNGNRQLSAAHAAVKAASVRSFRDAATEIGRELERARRYERPLTLLVLTLHYLHDQEGAHGSGAQKAPESEEGLEQQTAVRYEEVGSVGGHSPDEIGKRLADPIALLNAWVLSERIREIDIVTYEPIDQRFVFVLPESDRKEARGAVRRIAALMKERGFMVRAGAAQFPDCGLTIPQLVQRGQERWTAEPMVTTPSTRRRSETDSGAPGASMSRNVSKGAN